METGELADAESSRTRRASRTERKLWLASFHQDATIARSDAAILPRSARASVHGEPAPGC